MVGCSSAVICINRASCWRSDSGTVIRGVCPPAPPPPGRHLTAAAAAAPPAVDDDEGPPSALAGGDTSPAAKLRRRFGVTFLSTTTSTTTRRLDHTRHAIDPCTGTGPVNVLHPTRHKIGWLVGWSVTSLFSTNTAISETKGQGWRVILLPTEGRLAISTSGRLFV